MMAARETGQPSPITSDLAGRIYSLLLRAYPTPFRTNYGKDMAQLFRDCYLRERRRVSRRALMIARFVFRINPTKLIAGWLGSVGTGHRGRVKFL